MITHSTSFHGGQAAALKTSTITEQQLMRIITFSKLVYSNSISRNLISLPTPASAHPSLEIEL